MGKVNNILSATKQMTLAEKKKIIRLLTSDLYTDRIDEIRSEQISEEPICPCCSSTKHITKHGMYKGRQRYCCRECGKTFNELTGTCVSGLRNRNVWMRFVEMTIDCHTIREISRELDLSCQTILEWRHKLLSSLSEIFTKKFSGEIQIDEIEFPFNQKGRRKNFHNPKRKYETVINSLGFKQTKKILKKQTRNISSVLAIIDGNKTVALRSARATQACNSAIIRQLDILKDRLDKSQINLVLSDKGACMTSLAPTLGQSHIIVPGSQCHEKMEDREYGVWHSGNYYTLGKMNNMGSTLKNWVRKHFITVSTKYLQNYLNYYMLLQYVLKDKVDEEFEYFLKYSLRDEKTLARYRRIEEDYQKFLKY